MGADFFLIHISSHAEFICKWLFLLYTYRFKDHVTVFNICLYITITSKLFTCFVRIQMPHVRYMCTDSGYFGHYFIRGKISERVILAVSFEANIRHSLSGQSVPLSVEFFQLCLLKYLAWKSFSKFNRLIPPSNIDRFPSCLFKWIGGEYLN